MNTPDVTQPIRDASPEVQQVVKETLKLEHAHLTTKAPHINDDVVRLIKLTVTAPSETE